MDLRQAIDALPDTKEGIAQFLTLNNYFGKLEEPDRCPLANYFSAVTGRRITVTDLKITDDTAYYEWLDNCQEMSPGEFGPSYDVPTPLAEFIILFDAGKYPDLIAEDVE